MLIPKRKEMGAYYTPAGLARMLADWAGTAGGQRILEPCVGGGALVATGPGGVSAGAEIRNLDLRGRSGQSPMRLSAERARVAIGQEGFSLSRAELAIGPEASPVRLVAPHRRGFWWVKWVAVVELSDLPAWGQSPFPLQ